MFIVAEVSATVVNRALHKPNALSNDFSLSLDDSS